MEQAKTVPIDDYFQMESAWLREWQRANDLEATNAALVGAMEIYAEPRNWSVDGTFTKTAPGGYRPACGEIARDALTKAKEPT